jgi:hypothetical protein
MKKKILSVWMLLLSVATAGFAQSGTCGDKFTWALSNGTLTISSGGTGEMENYSYNNPAQWYGYRSAIKTVVIEEGATNIGRYAFNDCFSLHSVTIPNSVKSIGDDAFSDCVELASVTVGNNVESIGDYAFYCCYSLGSINIPASVKIIGNRAFYHCESLGSIVIPDNVESIGESAFLSCSSLESVTIPESVKSIGEWAFAGCSSFSSISIPNSVESIEDFTFGSCTGVTSVTIGNSVKSIGEDAFSGCSSLGSITIPSSVTSIGENAFDGCSSLSSISIPESVTSIGRWAFDGCISLTSVTNLNPTPQTIDSYTFYGVNINNITLYVPAGSVEDYEAAHVWRYFGTITEYVPSAIHAPSAVTAIRIYPDPATGSFRIEGITAPTQVSITDINGRSVFRKIISGDESIAAGHWVKGVYLVRVNGKTAKVIKSF